MEIENYRAFLLSIQDTLILSRYFILGTERKTEDRERRKKKVDRDLWINYEINV